MKRDYYSDSIAKFQDTSPNEILGILVKSSGGFTVEPTQREDHRSFTGDRWNHIHKAERKSYQKNAYRVLLTRARQGMVIVVPSGDPEDPTRKPEYYDPTFEYLREIGFRTI